jgi:hypothetical protein
LQGQGTLHILRALSPGSYAKRQIPSD